MPEIRVPNLNKVLITGRATSDSVLSFTETGKAYLRFSIASNRNYRDNNTGEWKEITTFVNVTTWGKGAERLSERIKKGTPVLIEGRLESYTREIEGIKRTDVSINAWRTQVLTRRPRAPEESEIKESEEEEEDILESPGDEEELPF